LKIELFITKRLAFSKQRSFSRFVVRIAIAAVALSIAVMIVSTSFVNGFQAEITNKIYGFWGHVFITKYGFGRSYEDNSQVDTSKINMAYLLHMPNVDRVQPFAYKPGIIKTNDEIEGIVLKGVDSHYNFNFLKNHLTEGRVIEYADTEFSRDILVSKVTAKRLKLHAGDKIDMHFLQKDAPPLVRRMTVCGIYNTGIEEYDVVYALVD
jgi:lipoprotein-releasing system permease protein